MNDITAQQIERMAMVAAEHGDHLGAAIYRKALDLDYSHVALSAEERATVDRMSVDECHAEAVRMIRDGMAMMDD